MRSLVRALAAFSLTVTAALAQTTGVPGINDLTINGFGSGTTSCNNLCFPTPINLNYQVSTPSGNFVFFVWAWCPCSPCFVPWLTNGCTPAIPTTACGSTTNQAIDINLTCPTTVLGSSISTGGVAQINFNIPLLIGPPCGIARCSSVALVLDPCGLGGGGTTGPFVVTQTHNTNF